MPAAISSSGGTSRATPAAVAPVRGAPRRLDVIAITTGRVPMIIVGSGPPARWMALARNR